MQPGFNRFCVPAANSFARLAKKLGRTRMSRPSQVSRTWAGAAHLVFAVISINDNEYPGLNEFRLAATTGSLPSRHLQMHTFP